MVIQFHKFLNFLEKLTATTPRGPARVAGGGVHGVLGAFNPAFDAVTSHLQGQRRGEAADLVRSAAGAGHSPWVEEGGSLFVWPRHDLDAPVEADGVKVVSVNMMLGGRQLELVEHLLAHAGAEVACLQEIPELSARKLGERLKMHVAFTRLSGKAILSKFPIALAEELPLEAGGARSIMRATVGVGARRIDVMDVHLTRSEPAELARLARYLEARRAAGRTVVLAGDFEDSFSALLALVQDGWQGSAQKRFDNILVTRDVKVVSELLAQDGADADHRPVLARITWG